MRPFLTSGAAGLLAVGLWPGVQAQPSTIIDLLDKYERGDDSAVSSLANSDVGYLSRELVRRGEDWINAGGRDSRARRRLLAATFGLELAGARFEEKWHEVRHLIEWGCDLLRKDPPREAERLWYVASVSLADGARDQLLLIGARPDLPMASHVGHAHKRFPDDARFPFAIAVSHESNLNEPKREETWESEASLKKRAPFDLDARFALTRRAAARRYIDRLREFQDNPALGAEAHLRTGRLLYVLHEPAQALVHFTEVMKRTDDPVFIHLAHLFSARSFVQRGERDLAAAAFRQSLVAVPGAQAASMELAALLFAEGRPGDGYAVMNASFAVQPQPRDPWRLYGYRTFRFWPAHISALRREIRR